MNRFVSDVRVFLVYRTLVILGTVSLPVPKTHPTKIMLAFIALHVIATAVLLDAYVASWAVLRVSTNVVRRLTIVGALRQPLLDDLAFSWRMIIHATSTNAHL